MPTIGKFKTIVVLFLALCIFTSFFYIKVWSSIDTDDENLSSNTSDLDSIEKQPKKSSFRYHQLNKENQKEKDSSNSNNKSEKKEQPLSEKQLKKQRENQLKEQRKLAKAERERKKEEKRLRKLKKLQQTQQLNMEPFPALISTNNARLAALNLKAFTRFCSSQETKEHTSQRGSEFAIEAEWELGSSGNITAEDEQGRRLVLIDKDFETFKEWSDYISNKNSAQEQDQELMSEEQPSTLQLLQQRKSKVRPLFWERPLRGWIVNYTALSEPCDRTKHTSDYCLAFLTQDHLYLIPNHAAREFPNKIPHISPLSNKLKSQEDIELDTYYSNGKMETISTPYSTPPAGPATMHFHIFWSGVITDKLSLAVHAFLFTQPLDRSRLHLWIDSTALPHGKPENYEINPFSKDLVSEPLNKFVKLHAWDQETQEALAYPSSSSSSDKVKTKIPSMALSDQARFMILNRYGGMYIDADVLLLRDMSPFYDSGMEFAYEWSNKQMYSNAVLRLNRQSNVARRILDGAKAREQEIQGKEDAQEKQQQQASEQQNEGEKGEEGKGQMSVQKKVSGNDKDEGDEELGVDDEGLSEGEKAVLNANNEANRHTRGKPKQLEKYPVDLSTMTENMEQSTPSVITPTTAPLLPLVSASVPAPVPAQPNPANEDYLGQDPSDESLFDFWKSPPSRFTKRGGEMRPNEIYHPARLHQYLNSDDSENSNSGLTMMPTAVFDPLCLRVDKAEPQVGLENDKRYKMMQNLNNFRDAFINPGIVCPVSPQQKQEQEQEGATKSSSSSKQMRGPSKGFIAGPEVFFTGAYAYHWHNNWKTPIKEQSWMGLMQQAYREFLAGERPNLYGEWFRDDIDFIFKK
ncbi:hypothetical protein BGZ49_008013 [Haplosporangium sp. Z 27]|nr:hypothetical protein BGZ49_008013 [Haplosporangium sp. Z 27]